MSNNIVRRKAAIGQNIGQDYYDEEGNTYSSPASGGYSWYQYLEMALLLTLVGFAIYTCTQTTDARYFAYNAEAGVYRLETDLDYLKARGLARRVCFPFFGALAVSDIQASVIISNFINTEVTPEDHLGLCLFIADPPAPPPPPMVVVANDEQVAGDEAPSMTSILPEEICSVFESFPFEKICVEESEPYIIQAICSCMPEPPVEEPPVEEPVQD